MCIVGTNNEARVYHIENTSRMYKLTMHQKLLKPLKYQNYSETGADGVVEVFINQNVKLKAKDKKRTRLESNENVVDEPSVALEKLN